MCNFFYLSLVMALSGRNNPASISELPALNISGGDLMNLARRSRCHVAPDFCAREAEPSESAKLARAVVVNGAKLVN